MRHAASIERVSRNEAMRKQGAFPRLNSQHVGKRALAAALAYRYHKRYESNAKRALKSIESRCGRTDPRNLARADEYARYVLGSRRYAPWLRVYTAMAGMFKEGWIPDNYYGHVVLPSINGQYGLASELSFLSSNLMKSDLFPDLAYYLNGLFFEKENSVIHPAELKEFLFRKTDRIVFKLDGSKQGKGVFFFSESEFYADKIMLMGSGVFQSYIDQHALFRNLSPGSVATLRITTVVENDGSISVRASYLRLGRGDETHVRAASHVRVPIDPRSGEFARHGYLLDWRPVAEHPDTGECFVGNVVPAFARCVSAVCDLHKKVPFARCVGWDVAVTADEGVTVMEWNAQRNDVKFSEATTGPCFAGLGWEALWKLPSAQVLRAAQPTLIG